MNKLDRFKILINHLKSLGIIENQQDLGRKMGYNNSSAFSQVINGKTQEPKLFMQKLEELYPSLNTHWLETGEGEMLKASTFQDTSGDYSPNISGNGNHSQVAGRDINASSSDVGKLIDIVNAQQTTIAELVRTNQEQTGRLLSMLERLTQNG